MGREAKTAEEIVEYLLANAIPNGECLECHLAGSMDRGGRIRQYVQVGGRDGKKWGVPRLVLHVKEGPLPEGIWALHTCDNMKCINIDHLFKGTPQDNTDDMIAKGRKVDDPLVGERRRMHTWNQIRPLYEQGLNKYEIADRIGVSPSTVWNYISERGPYKSEGAVSISTRNQHNVCLGLDEPGNAEDVS